MIDPAGRDPATINRLPGMDRRATEGTLLIDLGGDRSNIASRDGAGARSYHGGRGRPAVAAPLRAPWRDIDAFLREKEPWILAKLEEWAKVPRPGVLRGSTGESLPYLGVEHKLEVREGARGVTRESGTIIVTAPRSRVLSTLLGWLKANALESLTPRTAHYAAHLALPAPGVVLSGGRDSGACAPPMARSVSTGGCAPRPALADYVAAHEVAHLVEMNHSKRFWSLLARLYPAWREARERLELAGAALPIIRGTHENPAPMLRVGDLQRSVKFYTELLGMKLLRTTDRPSRILARLRRLRHRGAQRRHRAHL